MQTADSAATGLHGIGERTWRETLGSVARTAFEPSRLNVTLWLVSAAALAALVGMTVVLADGRVYGWEIHATRRLQDIEYPEWAFNLTANRLTNSDTPEGAAIILSLAALLWVLRLRIESLMLLFISVPLHVAANFPKTIVERERPDDVVDGIVGYGGMRSFPSGHAEFAVTFYGFLVYLAVLHMRNSLARGSLIFAWIAMVLAVGFARIEVGKHWPLDIIAGYVIGVGALAALVWAHQTMMRQRREER